MPIYEYACMSCESHFEELVRGDATVSCPECQGSNVRKQLSTFAVHGGATTESSFRPMPHGGGGGGGGGGCCGGSCGSC